MDNPRCSKSLEMLDEYDRILFSSPPVVECIFKNLNARDLCSCAQVCTLWKSMADLEKNRRKDIVWFCKVAVYSDGEEPCHIRQHPSIIPYGFDCELRRDLDTIRTWPAFCITFASSQFIQNFPNLFHQYPDPRVKKCRMEDLIMKRKFLKDVMNFTTSRNLPDSCVIDFSVTPGVIGCCAKKNPIEVEEGPAISGVLFPSFPNLKIVQVPLDGKQPSNISDVVPEDMKIQCVLAFTSSRGIPATNKLIQSVLLRSPQVAIGGLVIERSATAPIGSFLAFCGTGMEAGSIVIQRGKGREEISEILKGFRDAGLIKPGRQCVAFMFTCVCKGYSLYSDFNVESDLFNKLYPDIPLIGASGNGELGVTYLSHLPNKHKFIEIGMLRKCMTKYILSYTTVFVMMSCKME